MRKFSSVKVWVEAIDQDGKTHRVEWSLVPETLSIEQLREIEGMPHPIEPEVLLAMPMKLTVRGEVSTKTQA